MCSLKCRMLAVLMRDTGWRGRVVRRERDVGGGAMTGGLGAMDEAGEAREAAEGAGEGVKGARSAFEVLAAGVRPA